MDVARVCFPLIAPSQAMAEAALLDNINPSMLTECVDDRPLVVTVPSDLAAAVRALQNLRGCAWMTA